MEKIAELLQGLADQLGTTVPYLWEVLVRQAYVTGLLNIIYAAVLLLISVIAYRLTIKFTKKAKDTPRGYWEIPATAAGMACFGCVIAPPIMVYHAVIALANPEYWALQKILATFG